MSRPADREYLLTGVTGFVGKVLLESIVRQRQALGVRRVIVFIRPRGAKSALDRFQTEVATSRCVAGLPDGWTDLVTVVDGDLAAPSLGLSDTDRAQLSGVTHILHSAASVNFTLPVKTAARANITTSLQLLDVARTLPRLARFVYVSTAYVTTHKSDTTPILEEVVPLVDDASTLFEEIENGSESDKAWLARTGYPNTYTLTKAIAERLLVERRGDIPLSIVRPSIVTAARATPFPGWIDSTAGFGAFATLIGLGHLRVVVGRPDARLDLIPVDDVANAIIAAADSATASLTITHATAGIANSPTVRGAWEAIHEYFRLHPIDRLPSRRYLGPPGAGFALADALHHRVWLWLVAFFSSPARGRQARKLGSRLDYLNEVFPYFTTRSFDFRSSSPLPESHDATRFVRTVCRGLAAHVLEQNEREWILAGRQHIGHGGDAAWVMRYPEANAWVRFGIWLSTKVLRRIAQSVTVDIPSFERARAAVPEGAAIVLVPSHRSYLDFILCSYLAFARPDLGIRVPYVAAAIEFGRVPLLGRILQYVHAFYVKRGAGKENRDLIQRVHDFLARGEVLEFFVEGERSRSREFVEPKRGLLRAIQQSGRPAVLFPIAITYDRIPEEAAFARELGGGARPRMRLRVLVKWLAAVARGRIRLGRMHLACAEPIPFGVDSDAREAAALIVTRLRTAMAVTTFQLEACREILAREGWRVEVARAAIEARGGHVLKSELNSSELIDPLILRTFRTQIGHQLDDVDEGQRTGGDVAAGIAS